MNKNILAENMHRFNTKNLNEDGDQNNNGFPDATETIFISRIQSDWVKITTALAELVIKKKSADFPDQLNLEKQINAYGKQKAALESKLIDVIAGDDKNIKLLLTQQSYSTTFR
jgi:hypothetical protein